MNTLSYYFLTFLIYSFFGWILEIIVCSHDYKKLVNRGFLFGPYCPIYGCGALLILWTLERYYNDPIVVFVFGVIITTFIEYSTSYLLEKIFHNKWWDYSNRIDSINGRVCVGNMIFFGLGACAIIYLFQPHLDSLLYSMSYQLTDVLSLIFAIIFIIDIIYSVIIAYALRHRIIIAEELKKEKLKMLPNLIEKKFKEKINNLHFKKIRLFKAFPNLKNKNREELDLIKKWITTNKESKKK